MLTSLALLYVATWVQAAHRKFTVNSDGTVLDSATGLMWQQQLDGTARTWQQALDYCAALSLGGHSDWELPQIKELRSIIDSSRYSPAIDTSVFPNTVSAYYWSATVNAASTDYAWILGFDYGLVGGNVKDTNYHVPCVRR